ncbi:helix-turn-helix domain-containing protein [Egibacter rhizosphaerae]|nr:helix-turn-helix domain-containing protein [Egibacter rhizosphaerae]
MAVELVHWPAEAEHLDKLRAEGTPRLLLVEDDAIPPEVTDCLEDWVRIPAMERDILARTATLTSRAVRGEVSLRPELDSAGILRYRGDWVSLGPVDTAIARALIERFGELVERDDLVARAWPGASDARNNLDVQIMRLRRRLAPLGLRIRTVRSHGYVLGTASQPTFRDRAGRADSVQ